MPTLSGLLSLIGAAPAAAHAGDLRSLPLDWNFDLWIALPVAVLIASYSLGLINVLRRTRRPGHLRARSLSFYIGVLALSGALLSPLHGLGEQIFSIHMIEHEIVMALSAPLVVIARPLGLMLWALPQTLRHRAGVVLHGGIIRRLWSWCTRLTNATLLHGIIIWIWHVPFLFDAAVTNSAVHRLQHLSFFATAVAFWWSVLWKSNQGAAAWSLFLTMLHTSALGALMALAPRVLYATEKRTTPYWGLSALEDQQLAGVIMWVPSGTIYAAAAMLMIALWIRGSAKGGIRNV